MEQVTALNSKSTMIKLTVNIVTFEMENNQNEAALIIICRLVVHTSLGLDHRKKFRK